MTAITCWLVRMTLPWMRVGFAEEIQRRKCPSKVYFIEAEITHRYASCLNGNVAGALSCTAVLSILLLLLGVMWLVFLLRTKADAMARWKSGWSGAGWQRHTVVFATRRLCEFSILCPSWENVQLNSAVSLTWRPHRRRRAKSNCMSVSDYALVSGPVHLSLVGVVCSNYKYTSVWK